MDNETSNHLVGSGVIDNEHPRGKPSCNLTILPCRPLLEHMQDDSPFDVLINNKVSTMEGLGPDDKTEQGVGHIRCSDYFCELLAWKMHR